MSTHPVTASEKQRDELRATLTVREQALGYILTVCQNHLEGDAAMEKANG